MALSHGSVLLSGAVHHFHNSTTDFHISIVNGHRNHLRAFGDRHVVLHAVSPTVSDYKPFLRGRAGLVLALGPWSLRLVLDRRAMNHEDLRAVGALREATVQG